MKNNTKVFSVKISYIPKLVSHECMHDTDVYVTEGIGVF